VRPIKNYQEELYSKHSFLNEDTSGKVENSFPAERTVFRLLQWASRLLQNYRIETPRLDAEVILAHLMECERIDFHIHPEKPVEDTTATHYKAAIRKRIQCVPLQYITHHAEFMSLDFYVDERVLIPRPETELLVEAVLKRLYLLSGKREIVMVDIGTGSGNISVTLAKKINNARVFAIDISEDALAVAKINAKKHHVLNKITFLCGDIYQPLNDYAMESGVHFIVSNPPYIAQHEFDTLQEEVRNFEPYGALISGHDDLSMFKRIISDAQIWLKPGGFIIFEVSEKQAYKVAQLLEDTHGFKKAEFIKDYQHINRIVVAQMEEMRGKDCN
jgi:release factor glutamine methyltransferase